MLTFFLLDGELVGGELECHFLHLSLILILNNPNIVYQIKIKNCNGECKCNKNLNITFKIISFSLVVGFLQ